MNWWKSNWFASSYWKSNWWQGQGAAPAGDGQGGVLKEHYTNPRRVLVHTEGDDETVAIATALSASRRRYKVKS